MFCYDQTSSHTSLDTRYWQSTLIIEQLLLNHFTAAAVINKISWGPECFGNT